MNKLAKREELDDLDLYLATHFADLSKIIKIERIVRFIHSFEVDGEFKV